MVIISTHMKYLVVLALALFVDPAFGQDKNAILTVLNRQSAAWNRGDIERFMEEYWKSDSLLYVGKSGPKYGWQTALDSYRKSYPGKAAMGTLTYTILKIDFISPNDAFVLGKWHLKREKDEPEGYFTLIFRKFPEGWKIVSDHSSGS